MGPKNLKKCMKLKVLEFSEGWEGVRKNPFRGGVTCMDIFWNYTILKLNILSPYGTFFSNIDLYMYVIVKLEKKFVMSKLRLNYTYIRASPVRCTCTSLSLIFFHHGGQSTEINFGFGHPFDRRSATMINNYICYQL